MKAKFTDFTGKSLKTIFAKKPRKLFGYEVTFEKGKIIFSKPCKKEKSNEEIIYEIECKLSKKAKDYSLTQDENILLNLSRQFREDLSFQRKMLKFMKGD